MISHRVDSLVVEDWCGIHIPHAPVISPSMNEVP